VGIENRVVFLLIENATTGYSSRMVFESTWRKYLSLIPVRVVVMGVVFAYSHHGLWKMAISSPNWMLGHILFAILRSIWNFKFEAMERAMDSNVGINDAYETLSRFSAKVLLLW
jgi:hypothetical protein